jgi:mRNA interferase HigB
MKIIAIKTLRDFWTANPDAEQPLKAWVDEASKAEWKTRPKSKNNTVVPVFLKTGEWFLILRK